MELKVWVEGIQRIVCGVTETTTCHDVVFALAHATGKSGRFTLIERWRCNERLLAPQEHPLKILSKWGEYSNDVQFILQRSTTKSTGSPQPSQNDTLPKAFKPSTSSPVSSSPSSSTSCTDSPERHTKSRVSTSKSLPSVLQTKIASLSPSKSCACAAKDQIAPPYKDPPSPQVSSVAPPPYRDPPPPDFTFLSNNKLSNKLSPLATVINSTSAMYTNQYNELMQLVNSQRDKISSQQADLTKYDAEIIFWENKAREQQSNTDLITQELIEFNKIARVNSEKIKALTYMEEEYEIVRQQEKTLKSEITLLRSKLANCETELLQCKNKIRILSDDIVHEKCTQSRLNESQMQLERNLRGEMERLQHELDATNVQYESNQTKADLLKTDIVAMEKAVFAKKQELEKLVNDMKEANLRSLTIASADEIRQLLEGPVKAGSTRKIVGSPRQLENAVPTNKNPHGVWV